MSTQEHTHDVDHGHGHGHDHHHHDDGDTYFLDQICMVGISGAFGAICLTLYFMNALKGPNEPSMLKLLLGPQFHLFVLLSGIALVFIAAVRGVTLWRQAGKLGHAPAHDHDHGHEHHHHDHGECGHEHGACAHEHAHDHHGHHHHGHDHDAADHDHGWAPWRYVLLLVPVILFLLNLPNKGPEARATDVHLDTTGDVASYAGMVASFPVRESQLLTWVAATYLLEGNVQEVEFKELLDYSESEEMLKRLKKNVEDGDPLTVRVRGLFAPTTGKNDHVFSLVRYRIKCCGADALPVPIPVLTRDSLSDRTDGLKRSEWIKVTALIDVQTIGGQPRLFLRVVNQRGIEKCGPDPNPYIQ
jgi:hypothetical protein